MKHLFLVSTIKLAMTSLFLSPLTSYGVLNGPFQGSTGLIKLKPVPTDPEPLVSTPSCSLKEEGSLFRLGQNLKQVEDSSIEFKSNLSPKNCDQDFDRSKLTKVVSEWQKPLEKRINHLTEKEKQSLSIIRSMMNALLSNEEHYWSLACDTTKKPIAIALWSFAKNSLNEQFLKINWLAADPDYMNSGGGTAVMNEVISIAIRENLTYVGVTPLDSAAKYYEEKLHFKRMKYLRTNEMRYYLP